MRTLHQRPGRTVVLLLAAAALLGACAPTSAKQAGGQGRAATPAGIAPDAVHLQMGGFAGGPGFSLPGDLGGRPLVLNVWASWCGPCRKEMPGFQQVYLEAKDKVTFLGLDSRDVVDAARRFAAQTGVTYRLAADPQGQAASKLGVAALPTTVFIGADGTLRGRHVGALTPNELRANISRYLEVSVP
jgi:cytochrome c biogenesis protein CcmG/thiol:disulfide interchange protein DsbE